MGGKSLPINTISQPISTSSSSTIETSLFLSSAISRMTYKCELQQAIFAEVRNLYSCKPFSNSIGISSSVPQVRGSDTIVLLQLPEMFRSLGRMLVSYLSIGSVQLSDPPNPNGFEE